MTIHPVTALTTEWLPECDFAVLNHGFVTHGRDYQVIIQDSIGGRPGTHSLTFTHVARADCQTALSAEGWSGSWDDVFLDYEASKDMDGYVWGPNWSLAYPGITAIIADDEAEAWARRVGHPMYAATLETDRFTLRLSFDKKRDAGRRYIAGQAGHSPASALGTRWKRSEYTDRVACTCGSRTGSASLTRRWVRRTRRCRGSWRRPVGVRLEADDGITVAAPFGLEDVFAMTIRPNPNRPLAKGWARTIENARDRWPELTVIEP